jgi:hypothetical protein
MLVPRPYPAKFTLNREEAESPGIKAGQSIRCRKKCEGNSNCSPLAVLRIRRFNKREKAGTRIFILQTAISQQVKKTGRPKHSAADGHIITKQPKLDLSVAQRLLTYTPHIIS